MDLQQYQGQILGTYNGEPISVKTDATGNLILSSQTTITEQATAADNAVGLPTVVKVVGGYDGTNVQAIKTDAAGELQVDVLTLPSLPAGTNNIGDVDVLTLPALPTGTNDIGQVLNGFQNVTILASAARTVSGDTDATPTDTGKYKEAIAFIDVTAASGTSPTLDVKFQTQDPVSLKWFDLTSLTFTQKTVVATEMKTQSSLLGSKLRCVHTIAGTTPSFTFSVSLVLKS